MVSSVTIGPDVFFNLFPTLQFLHKPTLLLSLHARRCLSNKASHSSNLLSCVRRTASWVTLLSSSVSLVLFSLGCSRHRLLSKSQSGPANQFHLSFFTMVDPRLPRSARFNSDGQYVQVMLIGLAVSAIFFTLFATNTFHPLPGLVIQYSATILSIQMSLDLMFHRWRAVQRFFTMFAAMWPLTSSSLAIDVLFDIRDFEVRSPLVTPASCLPPQQLLHSILECWNLRKDVSGLLLSLQRMKQYF